jgi:hypothetical protein
VRRQPPAYSVAAQMARLHRLGRAHSHEGVTQGYHYHTDPDTDHGKGSSSIYHTINQTILSCNKHIE